VANQESNIPPHFKRVGYLYLVRCLC